MISLIYIFMSLFFTLLNSMLQIPYIHPSISFHPLIFLSKHLPRILESSWSHPSWFSTISREVKDYEMLKCGNEVKVIFFNFVLFFWREKRKKILPISINIQMKFAILSKSKDNFRRRHFGYVHVEVSYNLLASISIRNIASLFYTKFILKCLYF